MKIKYPAKFLCRIAIRHAFRNRQSIPEQWAKRRGLPRPHPGHGLEFAIAEAFELKRWREAGF